MSDSNVNEKHRVIAVTRLGIDPAGQRSSVDMLASICQLLSDLLMETQRGNSIERTGAVSSAQIESNSKGINCSVKAYAGSEVPVDDALDAYGRLVREANERVANGWAETVKAVKISETETAAGQRWQSGEKA